MITFKRATLVTGASKRIGKAIITRLAKDNTNVVIHFNKSKSAALALSKKINRNTKIKSITVQADLNKSDQIKRLFSIIKKKFFCLKRT